MAVYSPVTSRPCTVRIMGHAILIQPDSVSPALEAIPVPPPMFPSSLLYRQKPRRAASPMTPPAPAESTPVYLERLEAHEHREIPAPHLKPTVNFDWQELVKIIA